MSKRMNKRMDIIYEDSHVVICHKEPGFPVQTAKTGRQDMVSLLRNYFAEKGEDSQVFVVHRLDQPVEGLLVFARNRQAAADLSRQSKERNMNKCYLALAEGMFDNPSGILEDWLLRDGITNTSRVVTKGTPKSKLARLSYQVKQVFLQQREMLEDTALTLLQVELETGRHHQIRVQMANAKHPLVGDKKYNPNCAKGYMPVALCSVKLSFRHPADGKEMVFSAQPKGAAFEPYRSFIPAEYLI